MEFKQDFAVQEEYIQDLADEYIKIKKELYTWSQKEKEVIDLIEAETIDGKDKTVTLSGVRNNIKVEKRDNVSYPTDKGKEHPLRRLLSLFDELLQGKVRVTYAESGSKIKDLVDRVNKGKPHTDDERLLVQELEKVRVVKKGKPGISIVERKT